MTLAHTHPICPCRCGFDVPVLLRSSEETESIIPPPEKHMVQVTNPFGLELVSGPASITGKSTCECTCERPGERSPLTAAGSGCPAECQGQSWGGGLEAPTLNLSQPVPVEPQPVPQDQHNWIMAAAPPFPSSPPSPPLICPLAVGPTTPWEPGPAPGHFPASVPGGGSDSGF